MAEPGVVLAAAGGVGGTGTSETGAPGFWSPRLVATGLRPVGGEVFSASAADETGGPEGSAFMMLTGGIEAALGKS